MGPNLYITPPGSFTHFHQDGHGTVDSGHYCIQGYNEVVMLRRLPEAHQKNALNILSDNNVDNQNEYDALYGLPHGDGMGHKPSWPSTSSIARLKEMNYYPSVFILKPGQLVHINKGRLHAFRKMTMDALPDSDCHAVQRLEVINDLKKNNTTSLPCCVSIAWDWMFQGYTEMGMQAEINTILDNANLCRRKKVMSLAIPETSLLFLAQDALAKVNLKLTLQHGLYQDPLVVLRGILPGLDRVVTQHVKDIEGCPNNVERSEIPDAMQNLDLYVLNPFGKEDFFCKFCFQEISNVYLHCLGCEKKLNKDFNICSTCYKLGKHICVIQMNSYDGTESSNINHIVKMRKCNCTCVVDVCSECGKCPKCSCICHTKFALHNRFMTCEYEKSLLRRVKEAVGEYPQS
jgi:hypothetical protein